MGLRDGHILTEKRINVKRAISWIDEAPWQMSSYIYGTVLVESLKNHALLKHSKKYIPKLDKLKLTKLRGEMLINICIRV